MTGSPFAAGAAGSNEINCVAVDPFERFVYGRGKDGMIYAFTMDPANGHLAPVSGSPYAAGNNNHPSYGGFGGIIVHPSGLYLYAAAAVDGTIHAFSIDQTSGALSPVGSPYDISYGGSLLCPFAVAIDPTGAYLFAKGEEAPSMLAALSIDIATGALTPRLSAFGPLTGYWAWHGLSFHPTKSVLYTAFYGEAGLTVDAGAYALDLGSGNLTELSGSPYDLFVDKHGSDNICVDRSGSYAYSTCYNDAKISAMRIDPATSNLFILDLEGGVVVGSNEDLVPVGTSPVCIAIAGTLQ